MKFKPCMAAALAGALLLAACAGRPPAEPSWQTTLPASGAVLAVAARTVEAGQTTCLDETDTAHTLTLLRCEGPARLEIEGVKTDAVEVRFVEPAGDGYRYYDLSSPTEKIDYLRTDTGQGVEVRVDTLYSFSITVTGQEGTDTFLLDCRRADG